MKIEVNPGQTNRAFPPRSGHFAGRNRFWAMARRARSSRAFTLVEILVVIAIIGIIAGLTISALKTVSRKKKDLRVKAMLESLTGAIDSYHSAYSSYPPDNASIAGSVNKDIVGGFASSNQLFYELLSAPYDGTQYYTGFDGGKVDAAALTAVFNVGGIRNSLAGEAKAFCTPFPTNSYKAYSGAVQGFVAPVDFDQAKPGVPNWWHYDASSTFRHNKESYDLWAVYNEAGVLITNGNWKQ